MGVIDAALRAFKIVEDENNNKFFAWIQKESIEFSTDGYIVDSNGNRYYTTDDCSKGTCLKTRLEMLNKLTKK